MSTSSKGKFLIHSHGTGGISTDDLEQRAREIAEIDGRTSINAQDRAQARLELSGGQVEPTMEDDGDAHQGMSRDPSEPLSDYGKATHTEEAPDEQQATERLVKEGIDEAEHEQRLAARRKSRVKT